uniref:SFRICE_026613 n=1 Tax=Spodoptera frugiperda TaxID=7108 RepID=A0A2H1W5C1_SPOFR
MISKFVKNHKKTNLNICINDCILFVLEPPALDFNKHRLVQPIVHHARTRREISTTRDTSGAHHSEVTVTVPIDGQDYVLDLRLNLDLVTDNHVLSYQKNGKTVLHKPKKEVSRSVNLFVSTPV